MTKIRATADDITQVEADAIVVNLFEGVDQPAGATAAVDRALDGAVSSLIRRGEIKGKFGEVGIVHSFGQPPLISAGIVAIAGLGKPEAFDADRIRGVSAEFCRALRKLNCRRIATILHGAGTGGIEPESCAQAITEGALLGLYAFTKYKKPEHEDIAEILLVAREEGLVPLLDAAIDRGRVAAEATNLARDMVNEPANYMTPGRMAETAEALAAEHGLQCKVLDREDMEAMGMGALSGVARGSNQPPKLITLSYKTDASSNSGLGFLGKGITFDSGGISIKPSDGMGEMKSDMAGAAAVIAALVAIARLKPQINVTAVTPVAENLPSGSALRPGDVLRAMNGKTIEVISTDAEGRLILADALCYARKLGLSPLVDVATLTGACRIALGTRYAGLFANDQDLASRILNAAQRTGEGIWRMPLPDEYREQIKSDIADIKNTGERPGAAITAALFLSEFVEDTPWAHMDIAGPAYGNKESGYLLKGATGFGVRTLLELALQEAKSQEVT
ncbi:MAG: leucyl aminopeptidase [Dehalococcoidia bacterium]|nr:leucyl aminopeptidase [Dehalococcoidia bacterium]